MVRETCIHPFSWGPLDETVITADDSETWAKTQYTRSYSCNHMIDYTEGIVNNKSLEVKFSTSNWRVQAFQFLNQTSGKYDNGMCTLIV